MANEVEMRKSIYSVLGLTILLCVLFAFWEVKEAATADVQLNINLGPPPIVVIEPPVVVMIPNSKICFVPDPKIDIFFYSGYWWSPRGEQWYRARAYNGPWGIVKRHYVPAPLYQVPKNYRDLYGKEQHIPYGQWKKQEAHQDQGEQLGKGERNERKQNKKDHKERH